MAQFREERESGSTIMRGFRKGRGAVSNQAGRYERLGSEAVDDGWGGLEKAPPRLETEILPDKSRTVITRNASPDLGFDHSINPYRGCEHGCSYCYARPTHAFLGLSPGQDFESRIFAKHDAAAQLARELAKPGYRCRMMALGTNTDPYQPAERRLTITRSVLEVLAAHNHPFGIVTKSALVTRDIDIIAPMAERGLAKVAVSVTTLDPMLANKMEPRASAPRRRLDALKMLSDAGIPTAVMVAPVIPGLTDHELEAILEKAADAGVEEANYILLRLPLEIKELFAEWLHTHAPNRAKRVLNLMRAMRGGKLYEADFGRRQTGTGPHAELLSRRFRVAIKRLDLNVRTSRLDSGQFHVPPKPGDQLNLL